MNIQEFIQDQVIRPRLQQRQVMIVYDPDRRYRDLCCGMADTRICVVDASESSIESRARALQALNELGRGVLEQLLVYVPVAQPLDDEARQKDPFALYGACGEIFPNGDGDEYINLCLKAKPDHATAIRQIFEHNPQPDFAVVDAVGGGLGWPNLRALLGVESSRDILFALLAPNPMQQDALGAGDAWVAEARALFKSSLGLALKTRGKTWSAVADELWRFALFSEFVFDLPETLPESLANVPRAEPAARPLIEDLCERLRNDRRTQDLYIERAETLEGSDGLNLPEHCRTLSDLGERDTFPFEERTFLRQAITALEQNDTDRVRLILERHARSVWTGKGENQAQWDLIEAALALIESCEDHERQLAEHSRSLDALIDFYVLSLREVDRLQREFEQTVADYEWQDLKDEMNPVKRQVRGRYRQLSEKIQLLFTQHLQQTGWPLPGRLANNDVFDRMVAPRLQQSGHRVAYIMVDALRYELGVALEKQLAEDARAELQVSLAQLPSITQVGMASLLPGAGHDLFLKKTDAGFSSQLGDQLVTNVSQRMGILRKRYGQRFAEMTLNDFVRSKKDLALEVDLLVLRSVEIDSHFENNPETAPGQMLDALKRIRAAVNRLKNQQFHDVVIATDHGFFLNHHAEAGDVCSKLPGNWLTVHERCLLGDGAQDHHHYQLSSEKAGIRGDFARLAGPKSLTPYRSGMLYFHGGASLQECVLPVITLRLEQEQPVLQQPAISIRYKNGAKRITTRLPVITLQAQGDLFSAESDFEILLEAHDRKNNVVGEAKAGGIVDPATGTISIKPGHPLQITLKMQLEFEGKFKVKALNPSTLTAYDQIDLETDYTV